MVTKDEKDTLRCVGLMLDYHTQLSLFLWLSLAGRIFLIEVLDRETAANVPSLAVSPYSGHHLIVIKIPVSR